MMIWTLRRCLPSLLLGGLFFLLPIARADVPTVEVIARLGGNPNGYHPRGALVEGTDGNFYGTTDAGGPANCGTVFKITPGGTLTTIYTFTGQNDGANPLGTLIRATDGNFYGTTSSASGGHTGTVFKVTSAGALTTVHTFSAVAVNFPRPNADGANPQVGVIQGSDGNFYGTTYFGGSKGGGVVFKMTAAGAVTALANFDAESGLPATGLVEGSAGVFYGAVYPSFFKITSAGVMTTLHDFSASDVGFPQTTLVKGADGNFYGTSESLAVRLTTTGALTTLHTFDSATEGTPLTAPLILAPGGNFYGVTARDGKTGFGAVYQMTPAGAVTVLAGIPGPGDGVAQANALLRASDGSFYGTVQLTGPANAGTVFKLTPGGMLTTLHAFNAGGGQCVARLAQYSDGNLYGVAQTGGAMNAGTIFGATTAGESATIHDFNPDTEGQAPQTGLLADGSGGYYGSTSLAGPDLGGSIFHLTPPAAGSSIEFTDPVDIYVRFRLALVYALGSPLRQGEDQSWYTTYSNKVGLAFADAFGGENGDGSIDDYSLPDESGTNALRTETDDSGETVIYSFTGGVDGQLPIGGAVPDAAGNRYGVTQLAGAHGQGTVYKITPSGALTTLHAFAGTGDGALPDGGLTNGKDGNFYGTTSAASYDASTGNTTGHGTIFKITPAGVLTTLHTFASDGSEGSDSQGALLQASDGILYGTTTQGVGPSGGTVFSITTGGTFTLLHTFSLTLAGDGNFPVAAMIQATDGNLYGTTQNGGTDGFGTIYEVVLAAVPVITSAPTASATEGKAFSYQIAATNSPTSFGVQGLTAGVTVNSQTGVVAGTPTSAGKVALTLNAYNAAGKGSATLTLTIAAAAPVITSVTTASATQGAAFSYQITATNHPTNYGVQGLPAELTVDSTTGLISGQPMGAGKVTLTLNSFNSAGKGSAKLTLTVQAAPPTITSAKTATAEVGKAFSYQITASNSPTSFGVQGLPAGFTVNATTGVLSGTPKGAGKVTLTLNAYNGAGKGSATLTLTVTSS